METMVRSSIDDRRAQGKAAREQLTPSGHAGWKPATNRPDPIGLLEEQNATREADLVPVRHGRMMGSPFTFYRGAAKIMAADLRDTPTAGLQVQLCGDAHLSNFGVFASPERRLMFDLNDFDETLPGPFEYDVKRLAASLTIAARNNGFSEQDARAAAMASATAYRESMLQFSQMGTMDVWYAHLSEDELRQAIKRAASDAKRAGDKKSAKSAERGSERTARKAHTRDSLQALSKLAELVDGRYRIVSQPPIVVPLRDLAPSVGLSVEEMQRTNEEQFRAYRETLQDDRRHLLDRFEVVDMARKVVGVGSVGTRAFIVLLQGRDQQTRSSCRSRRRLRRCSKTICQRASYAQPGERVVQGQRMMQAASDIFLGWTKGVEADRYLYWRQLRDMKGSAVIETMAPRAPPVLRADLRLDPRPRTRTVRRPRRHRRVPRQERPLRPVDR